MSHSRRGVIAGLVALGLLPRVGTAQASEAVMADALLALLDDREQAASLGATWLMQRNHAPAPGALLNALTADLRKRGWDGNTGPDALRRALAATVADDYRSGDLITISGWQIARTQAALCALAFFAGTGRL